MKYSSYIFILPVVLLAVFLFYTGVFDRTKESVAERVEQPIEAAEAEQWEAKTDEQPPVTIRVTPVEFGKNATVWKFQIIFDTHSGSLDDDILMVATLADNKDNIYKPITWEGAGPGGHHREGVLTFNAIDPLPPFVELKVKNVGGVAERSFKWNISL